MGADQDSLRARVAADGFAVLPRHATTSESVAVAEAIGKPISPWGGGVVQGLTPRASAAPNTYSGIFGLAAFPFHTDLAHWPHPPRYIMLRAVLGFRDVPTLVIDGRSVAAAVGEETLRRAVVRPRRPGSGGLRLLRLLEHHGGMDLLRWDQVFIQPASRVGEEASARMHEGIAEVTPLRIDLVEEGDVAVIDNWRMLHSRPAIPAGREARHLERVYLERLH